MELAIQKDCENIIESFVLKENPRFESFVQQWKSTLFHRIYTAQSSSTEIIQSTNACIHYAKRILASRNTMPRLGALFLLYAIHFKQPTDRFHKIDVDQAFWQKIKEFIESLENTPHAEEAKYIFYTLLRENAFRFVASDIYHGLENLIDLDRIRTNSFNLSDTLFTFWNDMKYLTSKRGLFEGIVKVEEGYTEMKELMNQNAGGKVNSILPISRNFAELRTAVNSLSSFMSKHCLRGTKKENKISNARKIKNGRVEKLKRRIKSKT